MKFFSRRFRSVQDEENDLRDCDDQNAERRWTNLHLIFYLSLALRGCNKRLHPRHPLMLLQQPLELLGIQLSVFIPIVHFEEFVFHVFRDVGDVFGMILEEIFELRRVQHSIVVCVELKSKKFAKL